MSGSDANAPDRQEVDEGPIASPSSEKGRVVYRVWSAWQGEDCGLEPHDYPDKGSAEQRVSWLEGQGFDAAATQYTTDERMGQERGA